MNKAIRIGLFCSVLVGMGMLFGVWTAIVARLYAKEQVRTSRANRTRFSPITQDDGWAK